MQCPIGNISTGTAALMHFLILHRKYIINHINRRQNRLRNTKNMRRIRSWSPYIYTYKHAEFDDGVNAVKIIMPHNGFVDFFDAFLSQTVNNNNAYNITNKIH